MKYIKLILLALLTFSVSHIRASHILGGDMNVVHLNDNTFRVTMTVYRDCFNGLADFDNSVTVSVYEEVTDTPLPDLEFTMNLGDVSQPVLGDECFTPNLCLEIGVYELDIELPDRSNGYYLVWERCCRAAGTTNLSLADDFGMVFVATVPDPALENSNPVFIDYPAAGYFCVGIESSFSFGANDADGDSLVYILDEPIHGALATNTNANPQGGGPKPSYQNVPWAGGFDLNDVLGSGIPLTVDPNTGLVTGTAANQGQFCFGVIVEEWRDGVKIGEVRRELNVFSSADCNQIVDLGINGGIGVQTESFLAFNLNTVDVFAEGTQEDTISVTAQSDIFLEGNYDVIAFFEGDTINYTLEGEWDGLIRWDSLTCDMIRDEPYYVEVYGNLIGHCPPFLTTFDTLVMEIFVVMPDDSPTVWDTDFVGLPDPLFPWHEEFEDTLVNGELTTIDTYIFPAQELERCISISWSDTWQNHWDTLQVELLTDNSEIFGLGNDPTYGDTTVWYRPTIPSQLEINNQMCWTPECEQIREEPYRFTFKTTTKACDVVQEELHYVDIKVVSRSSGLLDTIPNVFTPNTDGMNDFWDIGHKDDYCIVNDNIKIFNRWGEAVYESEELLDTWDGTFNGSPVSNGEYFYVITYDFIFEEKNYTGGITILDSQGSN